MQPRRSEQPPQNPKPTPAELQAAYGRGVADVIAPSLKVLFCGINPGLYTAAIGHHFGRPGNRFWPALLAGGFTPRLLSPYEERLLLDWGWGITNLVNKATARADQLSRADLQEGGRLLVEKITTYRPRCLAVLGIGAYRAAFAQPKAVLGQQGVTIASTILWVLPNPSGLNAHYQPADLGRLFNQLRLAVEDLHP
jgi:TDG/mug DNA glycosylase family protein